LIGCHISKDVPYPNQHDDKGYATESRFEVVAIYTYRRKIGGTDDIRVQFGEYCADDAEDQCGKHESLNGC